MNPFGSNFSPAPIQLVPVSPVRLLFPIQPAEERDTGFARVHFLLDPECQGN